MNDYFASFSLFADVNWWVFPSFLSNLSCCLSWYLHRHMRITLSWELENYNWPLSQSKHTALLVHSPTGLMAENIFLWLEKVNRWKIFFDCWKLWGIYISLHINKLVLEFSHVHICIVCFCLWAIVAKLRWCERDPKTFKSLTMDSSFLYR